MDKTAKLNQAEEGCEFCNTFDFGKAGIVICNGIAELQLSGTLLGDFPKDRQFQFCPYCGRELD